jgi:predicted kinase
MKSLQLSRPHVLMMVGIPGSGKSSFAEKFAETFGAPRISFDVIRSLTLDAPAARSLMTGQLQELLKTRQTLIVDGATETRTERQDIVRTARAAGYEPLIIWVQTDPSTAKSRALKQSHTGSVSTPDAFDQAFRRFTPPNATEKSVVISGKHTYATQTKVVLKKLSEPRAAISVHSSPPARVEESNRRNITVR